MSEVSSLERPTRSALGLERAVLACAGDTYSCIAIHNGFVNYATGRNTQGEANDTHTSRVEYIQEKWKA